EWCATIDVAASNRTNPAITQANLVRIEHLLQRKSLSQRVSHTDRTGNGANRTGNSSDKRRKGTAPSPHGQGFDIVLHRFPAANPLSTWYLRLFRKIISPGAGFFFVQARPLRPPRPGADRRVQPGRPA